MVVMKASMSGIGASVCDQVIQHFLLWFGPDGVGKHENIPDLGLGVEKGMMGSACNAAMKPSKEVLCLRKVCGSFPVLDNHDIIGIGKEIVGHCWTQVLEDVVVGHCQKQSKMFWIV